MHVAERYNGFSNVVFLLRPPPVRMIFQEGRENIFLVAEREIAKMLAENLLDKFMATAQYHELVGDMVFDAS